MLGISYLLVSRFVCCGRGRVLREFGGLVVLQIRSRLVLSRSSPSRGSQVSRQCLHYPKSNLSAAGVCCRHW